MLNRGPHAIQWVLLDYFIIRSVFMNQLISPHPLSFLVTISFFSMSVRLFLFRKDVHLYPFLIPPRDGNPLQCSCLERGAWWTAVYGIAQSQTQLKRLSSSRGDII